jgi:taurine dioxygenase
MFANMYSAYETLSPGLKKMLDGMTAISTSAKAEVSNTREDRIRDSGRGTDHMSTEHPVVRTHPETGRKALYVNRAHTLCFKDMTEAESAPLLNYLYEHQVRTENTCRFHWQPNSIAMWDNRCTQHNPVNDYHGHLRIMHRITLEGDRPS